MKRAVLVVVFCLACCAGIAVFTGFFGRAGKAELDALALGRTDKASSWHGYTEPYEQIFRPLKNRPLRICEIGIENGGSLAVWRDYFPRGMVYGIDIVDSSSLQSRRIRTFVADQAKREQLQAFIDSCGSGYDIVIDDGGHSMQQQQVSLGFFFPHVKPGGYYIIEDVHTSLPRYYPGYGVERSGGNSTLRMLLFFIEYARLRSRYLRDAEARYLSEHIESCTLFFRNNEAHTLACILRKKPAFAAQAAGK